MIQYVLIYFALLIACGIILTGHNHYKTSTRRRSTPISALQGQRDKLISQLKTQWKAVPVGANVVAGKPFCKHLTFLPAHRNLSQEKKAIEPKSKVSTYGCCLMVRKMTKMKLDDTEDFVSSELVATLNLNLNQRRVSTGCHLVSAEFIELDKVDAVLQRVYAASSTFPLPNSPGTSAASKPTNVAHHICNTGCPPVAAGMTPHDRRGVSR